jgi:hypothetical protein
MVQIYGICFRTFAADKQPGRSRALAMAAGACFATDKYNKNI